MLSSRTIMKAMLLAAGFGERMLPLTNQLPKPAIPVLGRPIAVLVLHRLALEGIASAVVNLHHLPDAMKALLGDGVDLGLGSLAYSFEESILGTAGGLRKAAPYLRGGETILVRNADFLADIDLRQVTATHLAGGCAATLVLAPHRPGYTAVEVDDAGRVLSFGGRPAADPSRVAARYMFTGFQLLEEEVLDRIPPEGRSDLVRDVYIDLAREGRIGSHLHSGFWWEFGTPVDYLEGSLRLLALDPRDRARVAETDPVVKIGDATVAVGTGADFHAGVELRGRVALGLASLVAEGSRIEDSVIMPEAWVGPGTTLTRTIVAPGAEIPAGTHFENALVCSDTDPSAPLHAETERSGGLLVRRFADRPAVR